MSRYSYWAVYLTIFVFAIIPLSSFLRLLMYWNPRLETTGMIRTVNVVDSFKNITVVLLIIVYGMCLIWVNT